MTRSPSLAELTDHLGYWLRQVSNAVSRSFAARLEGMGVTTAEWVVMRVLHDVETLAPSQVAERMGMTRGAISKLADRLINKGMVARSRDPEDGRAQALSLTPRGRALVPDLARLADENDAAFFRALTDEEREALAAILRKMVENQGLRAVPID